MITVFAPAGIGEVAAGADLAALVENAVAADAAGPLADGDIVVVTSKIVSKAEGRHRPMSDREALISAESRRTVARRGATRIVRTGHGLTLAAAGVDASNVAVGTALLLPVDSDASASALRSGLRQRTGVNVGVLISDTAGRAWRLGQTDQTVGAAGVRVLLRYAGQTDPYGNRLTVTAMAVADELAAAADLVKAKLTGRPVAVVRGLANLVLPVGAADEPATELVREPAADLFNFGAREAVLAAALAATGQTGRYEELVGLEPEAALTELLAGAALPQPAAELLARLLRVELTRWPSQPG